MPGDLLVRGGTLVDGTGAVPVRADVRVRDGIVVEVAPGLEAGDEAVVDARGAFVAPGFIDCHTHYDPSLWWDPLVDPMPQHGVTTVVTGNCSLSLMPVRADQRARAADVFGFIEDIPVDAFATGIPWSWESYAEWRDALAAQATAVHVAALIGHSNLRVFVMGDDAWDRAATAGERAQLASVLADCLAAGALGLSTSFVDTDRHGRAVPSRRADEAEFAALVEVLADAPGGPRVLEFLPWIKEIDRQLDDIERVARWCAGRGVPCTWNQLAQNSRDPSRAERVVEQAHRLHDEGCRVYAQVSPRPFNINVSFDQTPAFVAVPAWNALIQLAPAEKRATLADESWRELARADWDRVGSGFTIFPVNGLERVRLTSVRPEDEKFLDATFADVVAARGGHPSDVLADWVLEHDLAPGMFAESLSNNDGPKVAALVADPTTVVGASDAGAHLQMMCGAGDTTLLLTEHVRDGGYLSVEAAVHELTGRLADVFGIADRGVIEPGAVGDAVVFALDELDYAHDGFVHDLPGGGPRLTRPPGGYRATV
ncbi:MAG TPA: amidohydrolase family protein, partial [Acidimicrobiia bacterium]|nr:amidohydrolase family protein [Acidimicrobiia bacterium]